MAIAPERISEFRRVLSRTVLEMCADPKDPKGFGKPLGSRQIDGYLSLADLSLDLVEELERLSPFGHGNPPLTLASRGLVLKSHSPVGRSDEHLQLIVEDEEGTAQQVIWWQGRRSPRDVLTWPTSCGPATTVASGACRWSGWTFARLRHRL
jgi:single-stranded DNA-specific DHH superfamily exonuclease